MNILVSACLLGINCRYDGSGKIHKDIELLMGEHHLVPVCPEQLGGMATPRIPSERVKDRVLNQKKEDVTEYYIRGAEEVLKLAKLYQCKYAVLKEHSPSCGSKMIYDGTFSGKLIKGEGVTTQLLRKNGLTVFDESQIETLRHQIGDGTILKTDRLILRKMTEADFPALCAIMQDEKVMYAYEHAFSDKEVKEWLDQQIKRYKADGFGLWAVISRETQTMIGQCGITMQEWDGREIPEIGYMFAKAFWHQGYATEAAAACKDYAFSHLEMESIYSIIRDTNTLSQNVARRNGMAVCGRQMKHYYNMDMPHLVFRVKRVVES